MFRFQTMFINVINSYYRYDKHIAFHRKYPEKFAPEEANNAYGGPIPVYLSNVCLRFIPVLDIVVHRHLEIPSVSKNLEQLLEHLGYLYKFHGEWFMLYLSKHYTLIGAHVYCSNIASSPF